METRAVTRRVGRLLGRGLAWVLGLGRRELRLLAILLVAVIGVWFFLELADEVTEGESKRFDTWVVERLREPDDPSKTIGPDVLAEVALELTALGSNAVLALVTGAVAGYLWLRRKRHAMWLVLGSVAELGVMMRDA